MLADSATPPRLPRSKNLPTSENLPNRNPQFPKSPIPQIQWAPMTVSPDNSRVIYQALKAAGITSLSALPETWLGLLLHMAEKDADMSLIQVCKEEEAIGIAAGAYFAGKRHVLLMQNHGFLAAINGIVSLAQLYSVPLCMLVALRGHWGEPYPWHTRGGIV